jgi:uncharacterized protein YkwD
VVVVAVLVAGMSSTAHADNIRGRDRMRTLLNQIRRNHDLPCFFVNPELSHTAYLHSRRMAERNQIFHSTDLYRKVQSYSPSTWGENVGMADFLKRVRTLWMRSPGHRANILKARFRRIGIGVVKARGRVWVTTIFYGK